MNKLVSLVLQVLFALISEIVLRKLEQDQQANVAEGTVIATGVQLAQEVIDGMKLPGWIADAVKNPVLLGRIMKMLDDTVERALMNAFKTVEATSANP